MPGPQYDHGSFDADIFDSLREQLRQLTDNSLNCLRMVVAATDASIRFPAVLPMARSALASSSQPVDCSISNRNYINSITIMMSGGNTGLDDGSMIVERAMSLGDEEW
jgi:hypothetical protein